MEWVGKKVVKDRKPGWRVFSVGRGPTRFSSPFRKDSRSTNYSRHESGTKTSRIFELWYLDIFRILLLTLWIAVVAGDGVILIRMKELEMGLWQFRDLPSDVMSLRFYLLFYFTSLNCQLFNANEGKNVSTVHHNQRWRLLVVSASRWVEFVLLPPMARCWKPLRHDFQESPLSDRDGVGFWCQCPHACCNANAVGQKANIDFMVAEGRRWDSSVMRKEGENIWWCH